MDLPEAFSFKSNGGGCLINSISESYFSSVNVAKYRATKNLKMDDPNRFKLVAYYPESS